MNDHATIDRRGLALARAIVEKLEAGDLQAGLAKARAVNRRWYERDATELHRAWHDVLQKDWASIKEVLLDTSERGCELRQNSPFCGILTPHERWAIFREYRYINWSESGAIASD